MHRESKGNVCPGEEVCSKKGPIGLYPGVPIEKVCGGTLDEETGKRMGACSKFPTKPGSQPVYLNDHIGSIMELNQLKECGAVFAYPDTLSIWEWCGLRALESSRASDREKSMNERESNPSSGNQLGAKLGRT